jgi:hypothetical protein
VWVTITRGQALRHFLIVGALALGFALTASVFVDGNVVRPSCEAYGRAHQLTYIGFRYPAGPIGASAPRTWSCVYVSGSSILDVSFRTVSSNAVVYRLVQLALMPIATTPIFFVLFAFGLLQVYGALGMSIRSSGSERP